MGRNVKGLSECSVRRKGILIFVIVGSQKFPFERLIKEMDRLKAKGIIQDEIVAQIGVSKYEPQHMTWQRFMDKDVFDHNIETCDLLVTHAGEGSIMTGLIKNRKVIAVPRYEKLGEHVSDHQLQIARALEKQNCIINVEDTKNLEYVFKHLDDYKLVPYISGKETIIKTICDFIG